MKKRAVCTIVSKNYLAFARTLARSLAEHQPELRIFVVLSDRLDGEIDPEREPFELIEAEALGIDDFRDLAFKYDVLELNTAVKPFALEHLFRTQDLDELFYLDPDTRATASLAPIFDQLAEHPILLTPHITRPYDDDKLPGESDHLRSGVFNLGFIGLARSEPAFALLAWWQQRCRDACVVRMEDGLFVDQKWIDLVPGLFPEAGIVREPGFNVAYWNLHERTIDGAAPLTCNGRPLYLFHFSGVVLDDLDRISKYQDRFDLAQRPDLRPLFEDYAQRLLQNGARECAKYPYAFGAFEDGAPIHPLMRRLYFSLPPEQRARFGDPFAAGGAGSFREWMHRPALPTLRSLPRGRNRQAQLLWSRVLALTARWRPDDTIDRLMYFLHHSELSVRNRFPDIFGRDRARFLRWYRKHQPRLYDPAGPHPLRRDVTTARHLQPEPWLLHPSLSGDRASGFPSALARARRRADEAIGVNALGYFTTESGIGEAARGVSRAIESAGIPLVRRDIDAGPQLRRKDPTYSDFSTDHPHPFNLIHVNADQLRATRRDVGARWFRGHHNIGYWLWELPEFPERWASRFRLVDEVWTPSTWCVESIASRATVPVYRIPIPVDPRVDTELERSHFGLPSDAFLFLFAFDFMSFFERKNPLAVIRAFREAFGPGDDAVLVIKSSNGHRFPEQRAAMKAAAGDARVAFLDDYLERDELRNLIRTADAYVSLHRSEGYGLSMLEAMSMAKPVIATAFSANLDYMHGENGLLVPCRLVEIEADVGPYERGQVWADPDLGHAATCMRRVRDDAALVRRLGERAREDIARDWSAAAVGARIRRRLEAIA